jgi:hypothetical protein
MRKILLIAAALIAVLASLGLASSANAAVTVDNGVGTVGKGDVQSALGWNNAAFDKGAASLKFTASAEKVTADYKMSCYGSDAVGHRIISQPGTTQVTATPIYNAGNGKQITGFNLTGQTSGFTATGSATLREEKPEGCFMFMNLGQGDLFGKTVVTGGLKVNGVDLPNTPVVEAAPAARSAQAAPACATRAEFNRIRVGMTVPTTIRIVGGPGKVTMAGSFMSQRQWKACPGSGTYWLTLTYLNGRLDNKILL